ncbi:RecQ family ATP-dependent DNA helicase [Paenibacillus sp. FSL H7-689]|uniref:RecQ family ATP-dependent DNA helicase n=1 Tax=Paenibacillus sp. FSL H7-689 TaxID=1227349 RepID=UPI0003E1E45F|nr:RecQ family ATP-dependent DNA helicase [Paenibacillus sp. FSL H7-689]ETT41935.1 RecQ familyATP-dependent DNA helicase [Paenibacillus sp. FSL H7-689]
MTLKSTADKYLEKMFNKGASFKVGQWEAINSVLQGGRTLVVQKTGWGKSLVYFLSTRMMRDAGAGPTIVISPLLSLMRNQMQSAARLGLRAATISSLNRQDLTGIEKDLSQNNIDILFVSPERLANEHFMERTIPLIRGGIGMLVIDEAHCVSDWGHDFRPDYRRISRIVRALPSKVPVLATTATANNRVIEDIQEQLGSMEVIRGPLARESLHIQTIVMPKKANRLAWLASNINNLPGSGIVYCATIGDCELVARWLRSRGISSEHYTGRLSKEERISREESLLQNEVKVLVANIALGMGFDKEDVGFVIHFQIPNSLLTYYQQIGRAGRNLDDAYIVLLHGEEDESIQQYFIRHAFPASEDILEIVGLLESEDSLTVNEICSRLNLAETTIKDCLKLLEIDNLVLKSGSEYSRTINTFQLEHARISNVIANKERELERMKDFVYTKDCLMKFVIHELDDPDTNNCGTCSNCNGEFISADSEEDVVVDAEIFLQRNFFNIEPRKRWAVKTKIPENRQCDPGFALSRYSDSGWGRLVRRGKYKDNYFDEQLAIAAADALRNWITDNYEEEFIVTSIPSLRRPNLVSEFANRVASHLKLPYVDLLTKTSTCPEQKLMNNSQMQEQNVRDSIEVNKSNYVGYSVILIDDMVDSRWTFTVAGYLLRESGYRNILPFALTSTSESG